MIRYIIIIIILTLVIYNKPDIREDFISENKHNNIWMYWENLPGKKKPPYLNLCYQTIQKNCSQKFNIHLLNEKNIYKYIPDLRSDLNKKLSIQQKVDYVRYVLLYKYGGIWIDADTIILKDLTPIISKLNSYDFVGFGCHFNNKKYCLKSGKPYPANWVMASRKNGKLMELCIKKCDLYLNKYDNLKKNYHLLGRETLWTEIKYLLENDKKWNYYHYFSQCIERDSKNNKLYNHRAISNEDIDKHCEDKFLFIPIYNTAPGFPNWFTKMSEKKILELDMLISKIFRKSLRIKQ